MVDRREQLDPQARGRLRRRAGRDAIREVRRRPHRLALHHHEAAVERTAVHGDPVHPLADLERDHLALVLECLPAAAAAELQPGAAKHERPVGVVLERLLGVDPAEHPDVPIGAAGRELARLGDRHERRDRQDPADPRLGPEAAHEEPPGGEHERTDDDEGEGDHRPMIAQAGRAARASPGAGNQSPEGTYSTRGP